MSNYAFKAKLEEELVTVYLRGPLIGITTQHGSKIRSISLFDNPEILVFPKLVQIDDLMLEIVDGNSPSIQRFLERVDYLRQSWLLKTARDRLDSQTTSDWFRNSDPLGFGVDGAELNEDDTSYPDSEQEESSAARTLRHGLLEDGWIAGQSAFIRLSDGLVQIRRTSLIHEIGPGPGRGDKIIPIRTIQAVHFNHARKVAMGVLEFVVAGDRGNTRDFLSKSMAGGQLSTSIWRHRFSTMVNENVVTFARKDDASFYDFYQRVLKEIASWGTPVESLQHVVAPSLGDELRKLKELFDQGVLTDEEFALAKKALLKSEIGD